MRCVLVPVSVSGVRGDRGHGHLADRGPRARGGAAEPAAGRDPHRVRAVRGGLRAAAAHALRQPQHRRHHLHPRPRRLHLTGKHVFSISDHLQGLLWNAYTQLVPIHFLMVFGQTVQEFFNLTYTNIYFYVYTCTSSHSI